MTRDSLKVILKTIDLRLLIVTWTSDYQVSNLHLFWYLFIKSFFHIFFYIFAFLLTVLIIKVTKLVLTMQRHNNTHENNKWQLKRRYPHHIRNTNGPFPSFPDMSTCPSCPDPGSPFRPSSEPLNTPRNTWPQTRCFKPVQVLSVVRYTVAPFIDWQ